MMEKKYKKFQPFDKVLVRVSASNRWECSFYSYYDDEDNEYSHRTFHYCIKDENILPYKGNEHLVGTTDEPEEEVELEEGEYVMVCDDRSILPEEWRIRKYDGYGNGGIKVFNNVSNDIGNWYYAIRFKDFDPSNMEETQKHILHIKYGKLVRFIEENGQEY